MKRADFGGSGEARPDNKMGRVRTPSRRLHWHGKLMIVVVPLSSTQRQAKKRIANAKRRRRDKEVRDA